MGEVAGLDGKTTLDQTSKEVKCPNKKKTLSSDSISFWETGAYFVYNLFKSLLLCIFCSLLNESYHLLYFELILNDVLFFSIGEPDGH